MSRITMEVWKCDVCGWAWIPESQKTPERCPSRICRSSRWNGAARPETVVTPKAKPERPKAPEIQKPMEPEMPRCKYEEYDPETGETYRCLLPEHGPKVKHVKATT